MKTHAFAFKGNIISPPAMIAVQGIGVKGGALADDGAGVWKSTDGLVSFTPASGVTISAVFVQQSANFVVISISGSASFAASTGKALGTFSGAATPPKQTIGSGVLSNGSAFVATYAQIASGTNTVLLQGMGTVTSSAFALNITYSVAALGAVNPSDAKTMLVDNDNAAIGTVYDAIHSLTDALATPKTIVGSVVKMYGTPTPDALYGGTWARISTKATATLTQDSSSATLPGIGSVSFAGSTDSFDVSFAFSKSVYLGCTGLSATSSGAFYDCYTTANGPASTTVHCPIGDWNQYCNVTFQGIGNAVTAKAMFRVYGSPNNILAQIELEGTGVDPNAANISEYRRTA